MLNNGDKVKVIKSEFNGPNTKYLVGLTGVVINDNEKRGGYYVIVRLDDGNGAVLNANELEVI